MRIQQKLMVFIIFFLFHVPFSQADMLLPITFVVSAQFAWYMVVLTLFVEVALLMYYLKIRVRKAFLMILVANLISALAGTPLISLGLWYLLISGFVGGALSLTNQIATLILMFLGSIAIELITIKLLWKYKFKELLPPLAWGNFFSYLIITIYLFTIGFSKQF